jgi:hypothetical protein
MSPEKLRSLKYIGYCYSQLPPEGANIEFDDFIHYAKFQLARLNKRLLKDPIWDLYTREEILIEYYAHQYQVNEEEKDRFIAELYKVTGDEHLEPVYEWLDRMVDENQKEMEQKVKHEEESISFTPDSIGD